MAEPWYNGDTLHELCTKGMRPLVMTGALVGWLRNHFSRAQNLEDRGLALSSTEMVWSSQPETSTIAIESYTRFDPSLVESRPALIVKRNAWKHVRLGIDNRLLGYDTPDGSQDYHNLWQGSHTVFVIAREGGECEKLATEVYRELNQFAPLMREVLKLHRLEMVDLGDMGRLEEASENFVVPITIAYAAQESWKLSPQSPPLRRVYLNAMVS